MTSADRKAELKRLRKAEEDLRFIVKRLPGLNTIEELERVAYVAQSVAPEDGEFLRRHVKRLKELRAHFYGPRKPYKRYLVEET
jgi:hypothetical protein